MYVYTQARARTHTHTFDQYIWICRIICENVSIGFAPTIRCTWQYKPLLEIFIVMDGSVSGKITAMKRSYNIFGEVQKSCLQRIDIGHSWSVSTANVLTCVVLLRPMAGTTILSKWIPRHDGSIEISRFLGPEAPGPCASLQWSLITAIQVLLHSSPYRYGPAVSNWFRF